MWGSWRCGIEKYIDVVALSKGVERGGQDLSSSQYPARIRIDRSSAVKASRKLLCDQGEPFSAKTNCRSANVPDTLAVAGFSCSGV
jgi:hypothetical protein